MRFSRVDPVPERHDTVPPSETFYILGRFLGVFSRYVFSFYGAFLLSNSVKIITSH